MAVTWKKIAYSDQKLDDFGAPDDNTDLDASTSAHGLCPKGTNTGTKYLRDDITWQTPAGGAAFDAAAGDMLEASADTIRSSASTTYTKIKEIQVARDGEYRVKFDLKTNAAPFTAYGKIYKNGVAVGTEQSESTASYVTKSEDIAGFSAADTLELWIHGTSPASAYVQNFRIYTTPSIEDIVVTD